MSPASAEQRDGRHRRAEKKRAERRSAVLDAALQVFATQGYHQTRVSDIIDRASIARGTFYLYFDSKNAIFHELLDQLLDKIRRNVVGVDVDEKAPPVRDQLLISVRRVLGAFYESPALARFVLREARGVDEAIDDKLRQLDTQLQVWLALSLQAGQQLGFVREIDANNAAWCILGSIKQLLELTVDKPEAELDLDHLSEVVLDFNLHGVGVA